MVMKLLLFTLFCAALLSLAGTQDSDSEDSNVNYPSDFDADDEYDESDDDFLDLLRLTTKIPLSRCWPKLLLSMV